MTSEKLEKLIEKYHHNVTITGLGDENLSDKQVVAAIEKHVTQCGILYEVRQGENGGEPAKNEGTVVVETAPAGEPVASSDPTPVGEPAISNSELKESKEDLPSEKEVTAAPVSEPAPAVASPEHKESKEEEAPVEVSTERSNNLKGPKGKK